MNLWAADFTNAQKKYFFEVFHIMLFTNISYLIFFPAVFIIYWLTKADKRYIVLLVSSYIFYACWNMEYLLLIFFVTLISYISALLIEKYSVYKKLFLTLCALCVFGTLIYFKYFNFILDSLNRLIKLTGNHTTFSFVEVVLPVGISFYIFQAFGYVIDVYRNDFKAEHNFLYFALFISFFPQLVAGPIERTKNLLFQLKEDHSFDYPLAVYGLRLMLLGYFKKLIIADRLAYYVDAVFNSYPEFSGFSLVLAIFFFTIQIYCDFSGYSDIAIGSANLLGIRLMTNFKSPYFSSSVKEFFSRWHISLSTWFRDYVYIPLGGNRCSKPRHIFNVMTTFFVSGLWHGAAWTYVFWGGLHGIGNVLSRGKKNPGNPKTFKDKTIWWIRVICTFIFCMLAWTFFRAFDFKCAFTILSRVLTGITNPLNYVIEGILAINIEKGELILIAVSILMLAIYDYASLKCDVLLLMDKMNRPMRYVIYTALIISIIYFIPVYGNNEFIYFQF